MPQLMETLRLTRRDLLRFGGAFLPMAVYPRQNYAQDVSLPALMILVRGESGRMDPELLDAVLSEFFRRGVPATVLMEGQSLTPGTPDGL